MSETGIQQLVIVGDGEFAEIAYEYFSADSDYAVSAFAVEKGFRTRDELRGLPVIDFEDLKDQFPPENHHVFVAISYRKLNRLRARLFRAAKEWGYTCASYVSSWAFVWDRNSLGENCFVFEDNTVQPFVEIGDNVVLWSGNHIGHRAVIEDHCFVSSHVVVSGFCRIGTYTFMGVNSALADEVCVGRDNWVGPGVVLTKSTEEAQIFGAQQPTASSVSSHRFFRIEE